MHQPPDLLTPLMGLLKLGHSGDVDVRPVLLRAVTDLFVGHPSHSLSELRQFEAIVVGLFDHCDAPTRQVVAAKLARFGAAPPSVVELFLRAGGPAAAEFLAHSSLVGKPALMDAAENGEAALALAVAGRADLDPSTTLVLAKRPETEVARALALNPAAPIDEECAQTLASRSPRDPETARAVCRRVADPRAVAHLFLFATRAQRAEAILAARRRALASTGRTARSFAQPSIVEEIERIALAGDKPLMAAVLARGLGATLGEATLILEDPDGEPLAAALAALGVSEEASARVFLHVAPDISHSVERVRALTSLVGELSPAAAAILVEAMVSPQAGPRHAGYAPVADASASPTPSRRVNAARETTAPRKGLLLVRRRG